MTAQGACTHRKILKTSHLNCHFPSSQPGIVLTTQLNCPISEYKLPKKSLFLPMLGGRGQLPPTLYTYAGQSKMFSMLKSILLTHTVTQVDSFSNC